MNSIIYTLSLITTFLGLFFGAILSNIARTEIPSSIKYLKVSKSIIFGAIIFFATYKFNIILASICSIALILAIYFFSKSDKILFISLSGAFYLGHLFETIFYVSSLISMYAIIIGTIEYDAYKKNKNALSKKETANLFKLLFEKYYLYIITSIAFYIVFLIVLK